MVLETRGPSCINKVDRIGRWCMKVLMRSEREGEDADAK
jgi:hypothetical protein